MLTFDKAFDRLIGNEGGETNWGITWPILHQAIGRWIVAANTTVARRMEPFSLDEGLLFPWWGGRTVSDVMI